jgi:predicted phosphoribosyltransferase
MIFRDRRAAGMELGRALEAAYRNQPDVLVLGLPRGGVPVAYEVAKALGCPFDVFVVRKLATPGREELAMGAIASGGVRVLNADVIEFYRIPADIVDAAIERERRELVQRENLYRGSRSPASVTGRTVLLVDDGLATGSTMKAAIGALRQLHPGKIVVAVPTGAAAACEEIGEIADDVVCMATPEPFVSVGDSYEDFRQTTDDEVLSLTAT